MNAKNTWMWLLIAGALFAFIFFFERHWGQPPPGPVPLLPDLKPDAVTRLRLYAEAAPQRELRLELTNGHWWITQPMLYPAQKTAVDRLLTGLQQLIPAAMIARNELQRRPKAEEEFGFDNPQASLVIHQEAVLPTIKFGRRTAPGDQEPAERSGAVVNLLQSFG
jgi:hypothetical protein